MLNKLIDLLSVLFKRPHSHKWIKVGQVTKKDHLCQLYYAHEKYACEGCKYQMHVIRRWNQKPKFKIVKTK